ncbi:MAG: 23S rRNA (guanosine(2251)-2'-O)-methyltransferase RlmB [Legionellales bacterium RIFCSPHIGHO2_12_FULL_35_11]|nr:MAG: 23S rRNA (guanosine(2251)-2'-O)-methyltransferase RlmB [Legionellales bacterium RIFCSPHIGHO2_12_FULL_35_11]
MKEQVVYGLHAVSALLKSPKSRVKKLIINKERADTRVKEILALVCNQKIVIEERSLAKINEQFPDIVHQGVIAFVTPLPNYSEQDIPFLLENTKGVPLILILDGVTDPHNLGACLRVADASGVDFIITPKDKNVGITPVVNKVASGAAEFIPLIRVTNLARTMKELKKLGIWLYGAYLDDTSVSLYNVDCRIPCAFVMGAEGSGIRRLTASMCDILCSIPLQGSVGSLNVSVAAGVCLYEALRQRLFLG